MWHSRKLRTWIRRSNATVQNSTTLTNSILPWEPVTDGWMDGGSVKERENLMMAEVMEIVLLR